MGDAYGILIRVDHGSETVVCGEDGKPLSFDCAYAARKYAKSLGLCVGWTVGRIDGNGRPRHTFDLD